MVVGFINWVAELTEFSHTKMCGCFAGTKKVYGKVPL